MNNMVCIRTLPLVVHSQYIYSSKFQGWAILTSGFVNNAYILTFTVKLPGCLTVSKTAVKDVFTQERFTAGFTVMYCPSVEIFSCSGQSGQYKPSQQNWKNPIWNESSDVCTLGLTSIRVPYYLGFFSPSSRMKWCQTHSRQLTRFIFHNLSLFLDNGFIDSTSEFTHDRLTGWFTILFSPSVEMFSCKG